MQVAIKRSMKTSNLKNPIIYFICGEMMSLVNNKINFVQYNKIIILFYTAIILLSMILFAFLFNKFETRYNQNGECSFYGEIIKYTMPVINVSSDNNEVMNKYKTAFKDNILACIGLNISSPSDIITKEISCLDSEDNKYIVENEGDTAKEVSFQLNDKSVIKTSTGLTEPNGSDSNLQNNLVQIVDPKLRKTLNPSKPEVFIYHTHTTESYKPSAADSMDPTKNVCAVGDELSSQLEQNYGISVVHDKTIHNATAYDKSYARSAETVDKYLKQYGDFRFVIDIHRDSLPSKDSTTVKLNGENVARIMFVMSKNNNPHYNKNITLVNSMINIANKDFKGLLCDKNIYLYNNGINSFNQIKSNNAFLVEVGSDKNDLSEAKATAKYLARIIAEQLNSK